MGVDPAKYEPSAIDNAIGQCSDTVCQWLPTTTSAIQQQ
jgi:hypothetical protein